MNHLFEELREMYKESIRQDIQMLENSKDGTQYAMCENPGEMQYRWMSSIESSIRDSIEMLKWIDQKISQQTPEITQL